MDLMLYPVAESARRTVRVSYVKQDWMIDEFPAITNT